MSSHCIIFNLPLYMEKYIIRGSLYFIIKNKELLVNKHIPFRNPRWSPRWALNSWFTV